MLKIINLRKETKPPKPTNDNPLIQVDWIFNQKSSLYTDKESKRSYTRALIFYKNQYLKTTMNYDEQLKNDSRFYLDEQWTEPAFYKLNQFIKEVRAGKYNNIKPLSSHTYAGYLSRIRAVMNLAYDYRLIDKQVINVPTTAAHKETISFMPYSQSELGRLFNILDIYINNAKEIVKNVETGV